MKQRTQLIRSSPELKKIINTIRAKYILDGKKPPTTAKITKIIAKNVDAEKLFRSEMIRW